jgi:stage V sporulation protein S
LGENLGQPGSVDTLLNGVRNMDRFFSKLDLRDIKIKPEGNRFLPTDDEATEDEAVPLVSLNGDHGGAIQHEPDPIVEPEFTDSPRSPVYAPIADSPLYASHQNGSPPAEEGELDLDTLAYDNGDVLKVSARSRPSAVAGAIAGVVRDAGRAEVQAIGAGATNQAVKAVAIARDYLLESGIDAICVPAFIDVTIDNEERTAIRLVVETR